MKLKNLFLGVCSAVAVFAACEPAQQNLGTPEISISVEEMTFTAEGGDQERTLVALFKSYRDKAKFKYPRLAKIFTNLMREYEHYANHEDYIAQLEDLEY